MKTKTEELLYWLLWTCETLSRPTWRNLTDSFEGWAYRNGLHPQLARLERRKFIESRGGTRDDRAYRLTEAGRLQSLGGRDPTACWRRPWDGRWRLVLFDFPLGKDTARDNLRRYLRSQGFGYLQNSVWITPNPLACEHDILTGGVTDVESLILLEARPCAGESDEEIVAGAWDFPLINRCYEKHMAILAQRPGDRLDSDAAAKAFLRWARHERLAWLEAMVLDPLLPERLLPSGYLGRHAWRKRVETLATAAEQVRRFDK